MMQHNQGFRDYPNQGHMMPNQVQYPQLQHPSQVPHMMQPMPDSMGGQPNQPGAQMPMCNQPDSENDGLMGGQDQRRIYRKKKSWGLTLNITIETPELDNRLNESFEIEIGSNQRLKILQQTILSHVKNMELRNLIKNFEKMYIYIEGKEPVARKSKSLAEMGVKDRDNLIVTTEMKLPYNVYSDDDDENDGPIMAPVMRYPDDDPTGGGMAMNMVHPGGGEQGQIKNMIIGQNNKGMNQMAPSNFQENIPPMTEHSLPTIQQVQNQGQQNMMQNRQGQFTQNQPVQNMPPMQGFQPLVPNQTNGVNLPANTHQGQMIQGNQFQQDSMRPVNFMGPNSQINQQNNPQNMQPRQIPEQSIAHGLPPMDFQGRPPNGQMNTLPQTGQMHQPMIQRPAMNMPPGGNGMPMVNPVPMSQMGGPQGMRPAQADSSKNQKQSTAKDSNSACTKKSKTQKLQESKPKKEGQTKSPTVKRPKEIQYSRLLFIQHYFNAKDLSDGLDDKDEEAIVALADDDQDKDEDDQNQPDNEYNENNGDQAKKDQNQIDSSQKQEDKLIPDDRDQEVHDQVSQSDRADELQSYNPYENDEPLMLEINSKSKAKCLKKVILEKKSLEGSHMLLFKESLDKTGIILEGGPKTHKLQPMYWVPFTEKDNETPVKDFQNVPIAFKIYLDISIHVEGRSHTFRQNIQIDPKDKFEPTLRSKTKTWNLFMNRGRQGCIVKVEQKKKTDDDYIIWPNQYSKTFEELNILSGAKLVMIEVRMRGQLDASEECQESEMEEMEDEQDEAEDAEQDAAQVDGQDAAYKAQIDQNGVIQSQGNQVQLQPGGEAIGITSSGPAVAPQQQQQPGTSVGGQGCGAGQPSNGYFS